MSKVYLEFVFNFLKCQLLHKSNKDYAKYQTKSGKNTTINAQLFALRFL